VKFQDVSSWRDSLSPLEILRIATILLKDADKTKHSGVALTLCFRAELWLKEIACLGHKSNMPKDLEDKPFSEDVLTAYRDHARITNRHQHPKRSSFKMIEK